MFGLGTALAISALPIAAAGNDAERAAALLQLIVSEYDDAVSEQGKVISNSELEDQRAIAQGAVAELQSLAAADLVAQAQALTARIAATRAPSNVVWIARKLQDSVVQRFRLSLDPPAQPDLARGATLYRAACAACHGVAGSPPAAVARRFEVPPPSFADPRAVRTSSPRAVYSAVTVGVPGKPMPDFAEAIDARERWDLAFYVLTLAQRTPRGRADGAKHLARARSAGLKADALRLSYQTDDYLRLELRAAGLSRSEVETALGSLRRGPFDAPDDGSAVPPLIVPRDLIAAHVFSDRSKEDAEGHLYVDSRLVLEEAPTPDRRARIAELLRVLNQQVVWRTGRPPFGTWLTVYAGEADARTGTSAVAACSLETEDDIDCEIHVPLPFAAQLATAFAGTPRKPRITADDRTGAARVQVEWLERISPAALRAFFEDALRLYQQAPALKALVYQTVRRGRTLLRVRLRGREEFDALAFPELQRRIDRAPPDERERLAKAGYRQALAALPAGAVLLARPLREALSAPARP